MTKKQTEKKAEKPAEPKAAPAPATKARTKKAKRTMPKPLRILLTPFIAFGRYIKGSWQELRAVRWPNRRASWALTLAVILFTLFFLVIIVSLDAAFEALFKRILL